MRSYERSRTCGADIPMEMYEDAARRNKYIATAKPVKSGQVRPRSFLVLHRQW
ncbi:hypothetical protein [Bacteroides intestinalis]|uniref:hypothetical protein n=1 Tax=Bacteroides intestinalis TaxID=329854 RepID=UPI001E4911BC|nr:hypothetical protein [Bacteroides intestinalis]